MKKQLYTNDDLFYIILNRLKDKGLVPSILDYSVSCSEMVDIKTDEWDCYGIVTFGCNEGIYLNLYLEGNIDGTVIKKVALGTFKTLYETKEAYKVMSNLNVEFVFGLLDFVKQHPDDFNWVGYTVKLYMDGQCKGKMNIRSKKRAIDMIKKYMACHCRAEYATLTCNQTDVVETFKREYFEEEKYD